ncbi:MAG TPA: YcxB family protein [Planktothrix sp.]|jgi:hypothetical protein
MDQKIEYTVSYTLEDLWSAQVNHIWFARNWLPITCIFGPFLFLGVLPDGIVGPMISAFKLPFVCLGCFGFTTLAIRFITTKRMARKLLQAPMFSSEIHFVIYEEGLISESPSLNSKLDWSNFMNWKEYKEALYLYTSQFQMYIVPKRCLSDTELVQVRELVASKVQKKGR